MLVKSEVMLKPDLNQASFRLDDMTISPELMVNIDETSLLLDPEDSANALTTHDAAELLKKQKLSISVKNVKVEEDVGEDEGPLKRRSIQLFAITTPKPSIMAVVCQIYDRNVTAVHKFKVLIQSVSPTSCTNSHYICPL